MDNNSETKQYEIIEDIEQTKSSEIVNQKELETKAIDTIVALVNQANNIASENSSVEERKKYDEVKNTDTYIDKTDESSKNAIANYNKLKGMKQSHFWTIGRNKAKVGQTQEVLNDIIDAINNNANATKALFNDQTKLADLQKKLYGIGLMGIASNRIVIREIKLRLENASKEKLSELARKELENTYYELEKQLKLEERIDGIQKDLFERIEDLNNTIISNNENFDTLINEVKETISLQERSVVENKKAIIEKIEDINKALISNKEQFDTLIKEVKETINQQGKCVDDNFNNMRLITEAHDNRLGILEKKTFIDSFIYKLFVGIAAFAALILSLLLFLA